MNSNILDTISSYGIELEQIGTRYRTNCPFPSHNDKTPSFVAFLETNSFFCFGCQTGGGPVQFVMHYEGVSKQEAKKRLGLDNPVSEVESILSPTNQQVPDFAQEANYIVSGIARTKFREGKEVSKVLTLLAKFDQQLSLQPLTEEGAKEWIQQFQDL